MNHKRIALIAALWVISTVGAFAVGLSVGERSMLSALAIGIENVQAKLLVSRIEDERHLRELLKKRCARQAAEFVNYTNGIDMQMMHDFVRNVKLMDAFVYVKSRNPTVFLEAYYYSAGFPSTFQERACD